ncbi:hypothetical protein [Pengzhenrongella frigida]|uniref:Uncharacterized protein n=1 Tax=Pengzhenrongella frigida TaxID=1259133 RepID=A0A4Q5MW92_9MICO|nr:hypothetical protein [Cellulomonas sp. HLT2-17]RYV49932.1 hypothetical protein EUA98_16335 [Cellulomonas sp. HLT2-17]
MTNSAPAFLVAACQVAADGTLFPQLALLLGSPFMVAGAALMVSASSSANGSHTRAGAWGGGCRGLDTDDLDALDGPANRGMACMPR